MALWRSPLCPSPTGSGIYSLRPFLGCLRGLRMNGVTLNLEGKANESLGVLVNCTGHCRRPLVPCRNYGTCVEHYNHYTCNCSVSAYEGPFCNQGEPLCRRWEGGAAPPREAQEQQRFSSPSDFHSVSLPSVADIGAYFEQGSWVRYDIMTMPLYVVREFSNIVHQPLQPLPGYNLTGEIVGLSFRTSSAPAVLLYVSTFVNDYLAILLRDDGEQHWRHPAHGGSSPPLWPLLGQILNMNQDKRSRMAGKAAQHIPWEAMQFGALGKPHLKFQL